MIAHDRERTFGKRRPRAGSRSAGNLSGNADSNDSGDSAAPVGMVSQKRPCASLRDDRHSGHTPEVTKEALEGICKLLGVDLRPFGPMPTFDDLCEALLPYRSVFRHRDTTAGRLRAISSDAARFGAPILAGGVLGVLYGMLLRRNLARFGGTWGAVTGAASVWNASVRRKQAADARAYLAKNAARHGRFTTIY
jgi:hypothetical protein